METCPVNESIRELSDDCWLIGGKLLLSRQEVSWPPESDQTSWSDGQGSFFVLSESSSESTTPLETSRPVSKTSRLQKVYEAGGVSTVWRAGEAFIKVHKVTTPDATREHVTLRWLYARLHLLQRFDIPRVLYHAEFNTHYYLVLSRLPGPSIADVWFSLDDAERQDLVQQVALICKHLMQWTGDRISGVDGGHLSDLYMTKRDDNNLDPQNLLKNCEELGMNCSSPVFYHCDLGPSNILLNPDNGTIGIIDWETAGFVPREWIRTKFRVSSGLDLPSDDSDERLAWRRSVSMRLKDLGFSDVADRWMEWWLSG